MAYKNCSKCQTPNGVRSFTCKKCGESFGPVKKKEPKIQEIDETLATADPVLAPVDMIAEAERPEAEGFKFKTYDGTGNQVGTVKARKTYERPDIEIERLMRDPEVSRIYPVPAGVEPEKLTSREKAYQVLGLGRTRAKSLLAAWKMDKIHWKDTDWKFVAQILGEAVVEDEPEKEEVEAGAEEKEE